MKLSAAFHKYGDAPRAARRPGSPTRLPRWGPRPHRKARGGRIPGVFDRRATQRGGMHRRPNATVFMKVSPKHSPCVESGGLRLPSMRVAKSYFGGLL